MLIRIRPVHSIAEMMRIIKTNSGKWIHRKGHTKFAWQSGYGVSASANQTLRRSPNTSQPRTNTTRGILFGRNLSRS
jgi:hypothetical protein